LSRLTGKTVHQIKVDVRKSCRSCGGNGLDGLGFGAPSSDAHQFIIMHGFRAEAQTCHSSTPKLTKVRDCDRSAIGLDRDFTVRIQDKRTSNGRQDHGQLSGLEDGGRSTAEVYGLQRPSFADLLGLVEAELVVKGAEKRFRRRFTVKLEIKGAEVTPLEA